MLTWRREPDHISRAKLTTQVARRMASFFEVNPTSCWSGGVLNYRLHQEMQGKAADPLHLKYHAQPGVVDVAHLELAALRRVSVSSWMPHFRLIAASPQNGVYVPQRRYRNGTSHGFLNNQNSLSFIWDDGSYIPLTAALVGNYTGLVNRDRLVLGEAGFTIALRFEVSRFYRPRWHTLISCTVAGVFIPRFSGELTDTGSPRGS